jgi:hypothetical protein
MANTYTTKTASIKATIGKFRKLDTDKLTIKGQDISELVGTGGGNGFDSYDARDPQLKNDELDVWNTEISLSEEGHIEVKPFEHAYEQMTDEQKELLFNSAALVIDNEVLDTDGNHLMYWRTDGLTESRDYKDEDNDGSADTEISVFCYYGIEELKSNQSLTVFDSDLSKLEDGTIMFSYTNLEFFNSDLSSLTNSDYMFAGCSQLYWFSSDLSSLIDSEYMFYDCINLDTFFSDSDDSPVNLSNLMYGRGMFGNCNNLFTFSSDLSSLTDGGYMFSGCTNLESFSSDLSSLMNGEYMFDGCKLDAKSFITIIHTLPQRDEMPTDEEIDYGIGYITIGLGVDDNEEDSMLFLKECDYDTPEELMEEIESKNWIVEFQFNGRPTSTYGMKRGETLPIYTKLVEVIMPTDKKKHKPHYDYTSQDGSKFYNIRHFHSTNGSTEGYDIFSSLEEAISTYNVTPKN